ncbi:putative quinone oxidoreductase [Smittium mucronatum]|uniref:Probable quinone oxidoreductase n=1 Tax=Smittium mucronatum TaxID=133383 RepID=A0A1R0H2S0_9FUNG|nr:putative quinone oxidoreductase [Smittium mucronatum]
MMNAIQVSEPGDISVLEYVQVEKPVVAPGKIVVKNAFSGVNFIDTYFRTGLYPTTMPTLLGREGSGTVAEVGEGVTDFKVGDKVAFLTANNSYAQYSLVDPTMVAHVPDSIGLDVAAAILLQGLTALTLTTRSYLVKKGDIILVHAAAGGTGRLLVQLCKYFGATVIGTTSTEEKALLAIESGADHIIYYNREDVPTRVREITGGRMVNAVFDGVGKATFQGSFDSLARCGTLVSFGNASGKVPPIEINMLSKGNITLLRPTLFFYITTRQEFTEASQEMFNLIEKGAIKFNICEVFELPRAADAHTFLESRKTTGKILISID